MNTTPADVRTILNFRHHSKKAIRALFDDQGFIEVDTPYILTANTPDPFIDPIFVRSLYQKELLQLHTSPELWLKRGLGLGLKKIYHLARVFRDDPPGRHHSREFSMLEWYRTDADLAELITDCEAIFGETYKAANYLGLNQADPPLFINMDLSVLFRSHADLSLPALLKAIEHGRYDALQVELARRGDHLPANASFCDAFFHVMLKYIEPNLPFDRPVTISRWPIQLAALAAPCPDDPNFCDRFEIYFRGLEIANAYQECNDADVLRSRFIKENCFRKACGKPAFAIDEHFLTSISALPKTAGIALGLDRLLLAISGRDQISDIIFGFSDH